jgi:hypothetical protein
MASLPIDQISPTLSPDDGVFELGIALEIFALPRPEVGADWCRASVVPGEPAPA